MLCKSAKTTCTIMEAPCQPAKHRPRLLASAAQVRGPLKGSDLHVPAAALKRAKTGSACRVRLAQAAGLDFSMMEV